ncbi:DsbA family protein [Albibacillus kandeliae]|uniref:DsbA family protein n=1 Tax=Albibacillus kandeliae TaxID=2174228 RepID=UPI000D68D499|nr:DsbA family protein [Albibacillus kandeliae]
MLRPALISAVTALTFAATPLLAFDPAAMSDSEREAFRAEVRAYLLDNPEVIMEAVALMQQKQADAQDQADLELVQIHADALFDDGYSWVGGNPDGDITLVEFMDYRCGYCRKAVPEVASLLESDGNIRLIVKEFPILGEASVAASRFAIATKQIAGDEAYAQVHDALLAFNGEVSDVALRRLGEGLGLETDEIIDHMNSDEVTEVIAKNHQLAKALEISGTPTFVLQDELLRGFLPANQMAQIIAEKRS